MDRRRLQAVPGGGEGLTMSAIPTSALAAGRAEGEALRIMALARLQMHRTCLVRPEAHGHDLPLSEIADRAAVAAGLAAPPLT